MSWRSESGARRLGFLAPLVALVVFVLTFRPPLPSPTGLDVDSSWRLALHRVESWGLAWGGDLAFTYGPFGRLLQPVADAGSVGATLLLFALAHLALLLFALERWSKRELTRGDAIAAAILYLVAVGFGLESDGSLQLVLWTLALGALFGGRRTGPLWSLAAGFAIATLPFAKFGFVVSGLGVGLLLGGYLARDRSLWPRLGGLVAGLAAGLAVALRSFGSLADLATWFGRSWQIAAGFGEAMSTPTRWADIAFAAVALVALALAARRERTAMLALSLAMAPIAVEWKHAFVRSWHRGPLFFAVATAFVAVLLLLPGTPRQRRLARTAALAVLLCGGGALAEHGRGAGAVWRALSPITVVESIRWTFDPGFRQERIAELEQRSAENLEALRLPADARSRLAAAGVRVAVLPWKLAVCEANGLACAPPRTLQLYSAYSPELDDWARSGVTERPPDYILLHRPEAQQRHFFASAPRTWERVESDYEIVERFDAQDLLLLARRSVPRALPASSTTRLEPAGAWYPIPPDARAVRVTFDTAPSPVARVLRLVAWLPPVELELDTGDRLVRKRIVPAVGGALPLLTDDSLDALDSYFRGDPPPAPRRFRLAGPGLRLLRVDSVRMSARSESEVLSESTP